MLLHRPPTPALAPFLERLWYFDDTAARCERSPRERALPTGSMDLVFRLSAEPVRVFTGIADAEGSTFGHAVICGVRSSFHVRDTSRPTCSVGAHFRPGGAAARLARFEELLMARRPERERLHPAVEHALAALAAPGACSIGELARATGTSHRRLIELFTRAVGLTPKVYARIRRFQGALERVARGRRPGWAQVALECGFYDQSHLTREFQAFAGLSPGAYVPLSADRPNHVPVRERTEGSRTSKHGAPASA